MKSVRHFPCGAWNYDKDQIEKVRNNNGILNCDIEITKHCNIHCKFCYSSSGKPLDNELTLEEIKQVITDAKELGAQTITLTGGEPTIHPQFFEIVQFIRSKDMLPQIFSNGTLITKEFARTLFENNVYPCISIESLNPSVHENLTGLKGSFEKTFQAIKNLIEVGYTKEMPLTINAVITKINYNDLEELWKWADQKDIQPFLLRLIPTGRGLINNELEVSPEKIKSLVEKIAIEKGFEPSIPYFGDGGCRKHFMSCFVSVKGFVQTCSAIPVNCGNIKRKSLLSILRESPIIRTMRNIDNEIIGKCSTCNHKAKCYGCRAIAYAMTGDMFESDPLCWTVEDHSRILAVR